MIVTDFTPGAFSNMFILTVTFIISMSFPTVFSVHKLYLCIILQSEREHFPSRGVWGSTCPLQLRHALSVSKWRTPTIVTFCRVTSQSGSASVCRATVPMSLIGIGSAPSPFIVRYFEYSFCTVALYQHCLPTILFLPYNILHHFVYNCDGILALIHFNADSDLLLSVAKCWWLCWELYHQSWNIYLP